MTLPNTTEQYKQATLNDINNDQSLIMTVRCDITDIIDKLNRFQKQEAFAVPQDEMISKLIEICGKMLDDFCESKELELRTARDFHESRQTNNV